MSIRANRATHLLLACIVSLLSAQASAQTPEIVMTLECSGSPNAVTLRLTLRNVGPVDTALVLGNSVGNGYRYLADSLTLDVKEPDSATAERFQYFDPSVPGVAGRLDPWIVPLPTASLLSLERPLAHFWAHGKPLSLGENPVDIRVNLSARGDRRVADQEVAGVALVHVFVGDLATEWVRVPTECAAD